MRAYPNFHKFRVLKGLSQRGQRRSILGVGGLWRRLGRLEDRLPGRRIAFCLERFIVSRKNQKTPSFFVLSRFMPENRRDTLPLSA